MGSFQQIYGKGKWCDSEGGLKIEYTTVEILTYIILGKVILLLKIFSYI